jgi:hypothetical protein
MSKKVQCATHGESQENFVCTHLLGEAAGLGFNRKRQRNHTVDGLNPQAVGGLREGDARSMLRPSTAPVLG